MRVRACRAEVGTTRVACRVTGDGDLSFSLALVRAFGACTSPRLELTATTFLRRDQVIERPSPPHLRARRIPATPDTHTRTHIGGFSVQHATGSTRAEDM